MKFFTYSLTSGTLTIDKADGALWLSVITGGSSSSCTVTGNISFKGLSPTAVSLSNGQGFTLGAEPFSAIDGVVVTFGSGTVSVLIGFQ